jgi:UvrD-like helicase C-terminal domain/AAA domain
VDFRIADTFTDALARLPAQDQKAVKTSAFDLQLDQTSPGLQMHRIDKSKDPNFWSVRVSRDLRIIVHKTAAGLLLAYVDHHDKAYAWAERRRIEAHSRTGVAQIVEVRERVEEIAAPAIQGVADAPMRFEPPPLAAAPLFDRLSLDQLLSVGVPEDWLGDVAAATEERFFDLAAHLPAEASEALLEYAATGLLQVPEPVAAEDAFEAPDAQRRFRIVENLEELQQALDAPWDRWSVFLHPSQRTVVERTFSGPARVAGSAGTGKTVVALHRAARLGEAGPNARVLLTTFSDPLARSLERKLAILVGPRGHLVPRITVAPWRAAAGELFELAFGRQPQIASDDLIRGVLQRAAEGRTFTDATTRFLVAEWTHVVDAWQIGSLETYAAVPRLGRRNRMGARQRERLWPVFAAARQALSAKGLSTWSMVFSMLADHYALKAAKPFGHVVVDEAQDLGVAELRFLSAITPEGPDRLFFAGDLGQRIFQQPFSWLALGVDVRGRSQVLKVNYRTSHQIRQSADRLLSRVVRDADGLAEDRTGTVSVFDGPPPEVEVVTDQATEVAAVADFLRRAIADGAAPREIGVFVRSEAQLPRARAAAREAGLGVLELSEQASDPGDRISIGLMHLAKGLEFKAVAVMACDQEVLPLQERVETVTDEVELEDVYETERQLFYVACTRARDRLMVSAIKPGSEFVADLAPTTAR